MINRLLIVVASVFLLFLASLSAQARVVINTTRIIFNQKSNEATVQLANRGALPLLVQSWIDDGHAQANPSTVNVPFVITPPVVRIDPGKGQAVRILGTGTALLPSDRESLFWFNILEIPPKSAREEHKNVLQVAFRTRIKIFYRPDGLPVTPDQAYRQLSFHLRSDASEDQIVIKNPSPYYITFQEIKLRLSNGHFVEAKMGTADEKMVAPYGEQVMPLPRLKRTPAEKYAVSFLVINDSGGLTQGEQTLLNHD